MSYQLNTELYFQRLDYRPTSDELKLDDMVITESHKTSVIVLYAILEIKKMNSILYVYVIITQIYVKYINKCYFVNPSVVKFIKLMNGKTYVVLFKLCKFIEESFRRRQNIVIYVTS